MEWFKVLIKVSEFVLEIYKVDELLSYEKASLILSLILNTLNYDKQGQMGIAIYQTLFF